MKKPICEICNKREILLWAFHQWMCGKCFMKLQQRQKESIQYLVDDVKREEGEDE